MGRSLPGYSAAIHGAAAAFVTFFLIGCAASAPIGAPTFSVQVGDRSFPMGDAIPPLVLPPATGGAAPLTYSLDAQIPGLTFDAETRTLSGTPTVAASYRLSYQARDVNGRSARLQFTVVVEPSDSAGSIPPPDTPPPDAPLPGTPPPGTPPPDAPTPGTPAPGTPPPGEPPVSLTYRGQGDQVFVLNPDGAALDAAGYALNLGSASAEVYLVASNTGGRDLTPEVERLDRSGAVANGLRASVSGDYEPSPRPVQSESAATLKRIAEFNNDPPLSGSGPGAGVRRGPRSSAAEEVEEGDQFTFRDSGGGEVPATAREVVTDGTTSAILWVADRDWGADCAGAGPCVTGTMVDAMAERFLRTGAANDIYDWVTAIFGNPWGPHSHAYLIPSEAAGEIHLLLFDIDADGVPAPGQCRTVGYFWGVHSYLKDPEKSFTSNSSERLILFLDSAYFANPEGTTWEVTDRQPSLIMGVLVHEFQHMIHFCQKPVWRAADSVAWLNEMAAEVARDLVADKVMASGPRGVSHDDPTAGDAGNKSGRLPVYNLFNDTRVTVWNSQIANYAVNYAFGAYLARTYGGAELFSKIVQSNRSGTAAVDAALSALGHAVSFGEAVADWGVATLLSDNTAAPAPYRYNPGAWSTSSAGGEQFRLGSINLYNYRYEPPDPVPSCIGSQLAGRSTQEGPYLHSLRSLSGRTQPPHSNRYATLGRNTGTVRLRVNATGDNRITLVVKE